MFQLVIKHVSKTLKKARKNAGFIDLYLPKQVHCDMIYLDVNTTIEGAAMYLDFQVKIPVVPSKITKE
jgi:hypothetical protein